MRTLATLALLGACSGAFAAQPDVDLAAERAAIEQYQDIDQKLQDAGWKLVSGNAEFCARTIPSLGLQLQDLASYGEPDIARAALTMRGDFAVQTAASGSPVAQSGQFARNREITRIGAVDPNEWETQERFDWKRLVRTHDWIDAQLSAAGALTFTFADGAQATLEPVPVCASRFEIVGEGTIAVADGKRVVMGVDFPGFAYPESMFAASVAHELAHNLLEHAVWLDAQGRSRRNVRQAEREADRLMPWLLANAGLDPANAVEFMQTWGPKHDGGLFRKRTHDGWDERVEFIEDELPRIRALMKSEGKADWSTHFKRDIDPLGTGNLARNE
jgi:hypothetical protein